MFTRSKPQPALPQTPEELAKEAPRPSIHDLSFSELKAFHQHVGEVLAQKEAQARLDFKRDFVDRMDALGLTIDDLKPEPPKKERKKKEPRDLAPKYRHPDVLDWTWHGVGRPPKWMKELLEAGRSLEEFEIAGASPSATGPSPK